MHTIVKTSAPWLLALGLVACSSGSDDPPVVSTTNLNTLSGKIAAPGGGPLVGATIRFEGAETTTGSTGAFFLPGIGAVPVGARLVEIDGTTAITGGSYPDLEVVLDVAAGQTDLILPQQIVLPDLTSVDAANQMVTTDVDGSTDQAIDLDGPAGDIGLDGPIGTIITLGGTPASGPVDLNVTPVPNDEVPMPLPDGLVGSAFVTIQPGNARFTTPTGGGLDVRLPNGLDLPIGTMVDVWSFDHDVGDWVNRSDETGNQGVVVDLGAGETAVDATAVITEGGWHAPVVPVDVTCATTIVGRIVDGSGSPIANVSVFTSLGQFTLSGTDGTFSLASVPAYDQADTMTCTTTDVNVSAVAPASLGTTLDVDTTVLAGSVLAGDVTDVGDITLNVPDTGCVTGRVLGIADASVGDVTLTGPTALSITPAANGNFFDCSLSPGAYTASYQFPSEPSPTEAMFDVVAGEVTTIVLQAATGTGTSSVTVNVQRRGNGVVPGATPVDGALVLLTGADSGSSAGLLQMTDVNGQTTFSNVTPPYTATAVASFASEGQYPGSTIRQACSVVGITPVADQIGLLLNLGGEDGPAAPSADATLTGTLTGVPVDCLVDLRVTNREFAGEEPTFQNFDLGESTSYTLAVPSGQTLDLFFARVCETSTSGLGYSLAIPALTLGETRTLDLDLSTGLALLDQSITISASGVESPSTAVYAIELEQTDAANDFVNFVEVDEDFATELPASVLAPDLSMAPSNLFDNAIQFDSFYGAQNSTRFQEVVTKVETTSNLAVVLPASTNLISPASGSTIETGDFQGQTFVFTVPGGTNGVNLFELRGVTLNAFGAEGGSTRVDWTIWTAPNVSSVTIPMAPSQVLGQGTYEVEFVGVRFEGVTASLAAAFDEDPNARINALLADSTVFRSGGIEFSIDVADPIE